MKNYDRETEREREAIGIVLSMIGRRGGQAPKTITPKDAKRRGDQLRKWHREQKAIKRVRT